MSEQKFKRGDVVEMTDGSVYVVAEEKLSPNPPHLGPYVYMEAVIFETAHHLRGKPAREYSIDPEALTKIGNIYE